MNVWIDGFTIAGIYVLLALGLNIVVGLSGLLDLGYAAFFAIGAYTYAFAASPFTGNDFPFWPMLLVGALMAATFGILLGAPTLRLRGDYLAIVTLGFGEIVPIVILNSSKYTDGPNGIGGISPPSIGDFVFPTTGNPWPFYLTMIALITLSMILDLPAPGLAPGPRLDGDPRGRAGGRGQRREHGDDEAAGLRPGRVDGRAGRRLPGQQAPDGDAEPVPLRRLVHRPGHGRPGRHGQHLGRGGRGLHHLHDPERVPQAAQHLLRQRARARS